MATLRPSVTKDDGLIQRIVKYIPVEIIAAYVAIMAYLTIDDLRDIAIYKGATIALIFITPLWSYLATIDRQNPSTNNKNRAIYHACVAFFTFPIWIYTDGNPILIEILKDAGHSYYAKLGSISLILFSIIAALLGNLIFKDPLKL